MPTFQVDIEKVRDGEFWTNRYFIDRGTLAIANLAAEDIVAGERTFHRTGITFSKMRVRTTTPGDDAFITTPLSGTGEVSPSGNYLPLFNVVRADFSIVQGGRPSRKYYRVGLCGGDVEPGYTFNSSYVNLILTALTDMMDAVAAGGSPILDPDNQSWEAATVFPQIGMRQLRKGSRRRTEPIL